MIVQGQCVRVNGWLQGQAVAAAPQAAPYGQATAQSYGDNTQAWANYTYQQAAWQQHQGVYLSCGQERLDSAAGGILTVVGLPDCVLDAEHARPMVPVR
jgi:hypothetical protein